MQSAPAPVHRTQTNLKCFYDNLAGQWARDEAMFRDDLISRPQIVQLAQEMGSGKVILDCGCGDGNLARLMSPFAKEVIGVDICPAMLAEAKKRLEDHNNIRYVEGDMLNLKETAGLEAESVDLCVAVYAVCCLENQEQLNRAFGQIYETLKPGGEAIIQIPQPLESYFKVSSLWAMDENPPENYFASGRVVFRNLKTMRGGQLRVARYHFTLSDYFNAVITSGLSLKQVIEPRPSDRLVAQFRDLKRESQLPFSIILLAQR